MRLNLESLYRVCWVDISSGKTGKKGPRSRSAYVVLGQDELERKFLLETYAAHITTSEFIEKLYRCAERWRLRVMGFDATATQGTFVDTFEIDARKSGRALPMIQRVALKSDKVARIENAIQPEAAAGRLFRLEEARCVELKGEWESFPGGFYMDILDCVASGIQYLLPKKAEKVKENEQTRELRNYLKNSGASSEYIERRVREVYPQSVI